MFIVEKIMDLGVHKHLVLKNGNANTYAKIDLNLGGSLQELTLNGKEIIKDLYPFEYKKSFASAILFPFVNRIDDGIYQFKNRNYQLDINDPETNSAIHGLVFDKTFKFEKQKSTIQSSSVSISYRENKGIVGFPFLYDIDLNYLLDAVSLTLSASIKNVDSEAFPFSLGWHPYFYSNDLFESHLIVDQPDVSLEKLYGIQLKRKPMDFQGNFQIKDHQLDNCYRLNANTLEFNTPEYRVNYSVSSDDAFMQLYTPSIRNALAIELQTSPPNSFNNKIGLQILQPNDSFEMSWKIKLNQTN